MPRPQYDTNSLDRLVNTANAFEGTSVPPKAAGGRRIPTVSKFTVLRNEPCEGGAWVTLGWFQEELNPTDYLEIFAYGNSSTNITSEATPRDKWKGLPKQNPIVQGVKASEPPIKMFVPAMAPTTVTFAIIVRHSSGMLGDYDFLNETTANISPIWTRWRSVTNGTYTIRPDEPNTFWLCDATAGVVTVNLPNIAEVADGFPVHLKKMDASANNVTIQPISSDGIDGGGAGTALNFNTQYHTRHIMANKATSTWIRLPV